MRKFYFVPAVLLVITCFTGCVNIVQKAVLNYDGSGSMDIHYWTKSSNIIGDEIGVYGFSELKIKKNYTSPNSEVNEIRILKDETPDSLTEVFCRVSFNDINKISSAWSFSGVRAGWKETDKGMNFVYRILKDTVSAKSFDSDEYTISVSFDFPGDVIESDGIFSTRTVKWWKTQADLINDIILTAIIRTK